MNDTSSADDTSSETVKTAYASVLPRRRRSPSDSPESAVGLVGPPSEPREADAYELLDVPQPPPVPNGWYAIAASADLAPGDVTPVVAVQRELVVFRDADGRAWVLDAHCPHNGAHLGGGHVVGEVLQCPYHGWRFAGTGECTEIPYSQGRIPSRACVRSYRVREQDGMVLFWYHAGGRDPEYEVPRMFETGDPGWTDAYVYRQVLTAALQEMGENNVDYTHFHYVHQREALNDSTSVFTTDGPFSTVTEKFVDGDVSFTRYTYGPGIALLRVPELMTILTATTPIDRRNCRLLWHFHFPLALAASAADLIEGVVGEFGLQADVPIWRDKVYRERPLLVKGDGPIAEFRRWYSQFYEGN